MDGKHYLAPERIRRYIDSVAQPEPESLARLREETAALPDAELQITPEQGRFFQILIRATGARRTLDIGVFTGYSALAVALALPEEGRVVACDVSEEFTAVARRHWRRAGVEGKIDLRLGPAAETLRRLVEGGEAETFDFAFIDADKTGYDTYYEQCLRLVRRGGLIALDNMLQHGQIVDEDPNDRGRAVRRALSEKIARDTRVEAVLLPFVDGITLAVKL